MLESGEYMRAVIFDMDGVIFDTERAVIDVWKNVADKYGIPDIIEYCTECLGVNAAEAKVKFSARYGGKYNYDELRAEKTGKVVEMFSRGEIAVKPGAENILKNLKLRGYKVALASSTREEAVRKELTAAGLIEYFDEIATGDMVSRSKPAPDIFLMACEKLGVSPEESFGIEDSFNGIRSCHSAGLVTIMVPDILQPDEEIKELADAVLPDLDSALEYIVKMTDN